LGQIHTVWAGSTVAVAVAIAIAVAPGRQATEDAAVSDSLSERKGPTAN
jgi:hypothetical protein